MFSFPAILAPSGNKSKSHLNFGTFTIHVCIWQLFIDQDISTSLEGASKNTLISLKRTKYKWNKLLNLKKNSMRDISDSSIGFRYKYVFFQKKIDPSVYLFQNAVWFLHAYLITIVTVKNAYTFLLKNTQLTLFVVLLQ